MSGVTVLEAGPRALLVELASGEEVEAFHAELLRRRAAGELPVVREIVPGARTVLLDGVEDRTLAGRLRSWTVPPLDRGEGAAVEIPVVYDGPDLADVAEAWGSPPTRCRSSTPARNSGSPSADSRPASDISRDCRDT